MSTFTANNLVVTEKGQEIHSVIGSLLSVIINFNYQVSLKHLAQEE